jgi:hypothetical protein
MKFSRTMAVMAASVIAAATGIVGAGAASAASPQAFCVNGSSVCAVGEGASSAVFMFASGSPTAWLFNNQTHPPAQIQQAGADLCLQLDHSAGNIVIEATCNRASYQTWQAAPIITNAPINGIAYVSEWDTNLCLTYNADEEILDAVNCDGAWYQAFG